MQERIILARLKARKHLTYILVGALVLSLALLLFLLNTATPNPAITTLLGAAVGALGTALVTMVNAVAATDKQDPGGEDESQPGG